MIQITPGVDIGPGINIVSEYIKVTGYYIGVVNGGGNGWTINTTPAYSVPTGYRFIGDMTFDRSYTNSSLTISANGRSLTGLTNTVGLTNYRIRSSDKIMFSMTLLNANNIGDNIEIGIASRALFPLTTGQFGTPPQNTGYFAAFYDDGATVMYGPGSSLTSQLWAGLVRFQSPGSVVDVALNVPLRKMWIRVNNSAWHAQRISPSVAGGDPVTGSGGFSLTNNTDLV
jgi:hypothetical protein